MEKQDREEDVEETGENVAWRMKEVVTVMEVIVNVTGEQDVMDM